MKSKATAPPTVVITSPTSVVSEAADNMAPPSQQPPESPVRRGKAEPASIGLSSRGNTRACGGTATRRSAGGGQTASPSPAGRITAPGTSPGPGRTPQTRRREFSLSSAAEKGTTPPNGSPRSRENSSNNNSNSRAQHHQIATTTKSARASSSATRSNKSEFPGENGEPCGRKSSNSSQDSGIGRESQPRSTSTSAAASRSARNSSGGKFAKNSSGNNNSHSNHSSSSSHHNSSHSNHNNNPTILTLGPGEDAASDHEAVRHRRLFQALLNNSSNSDTNSNVELGMVRVPSELLVDLIHMGDIHTYYDVQAIPVASGLFATVRKCTHKETGVEYAAKFSSRVRCGVDCTAEVLHEIALLSICSESSKIVHLKDVFQNQQEIVLVLEYAPGGDFQSVLDDDMVPFEQDVQGFMVQLLEALTFIHQRNIAHLDIKPQNIVLMSEFPNCEIKLCDLEVSRVIQDTEQIREIIGTPDYVAPEILQLEPITLAADIWSLGVLAYVLLTGFSPFGGDTDQETLRNITTAPLDFPAELFEGVSDDAKDFIAQCLNRDPLKRPTVEECYQHAWLSQNVEPPSPSPLMLKIPAPDHFVLAPPPTATSLIISNGSGPHHSSPSSRRSCQTCRDKITERKRYLSKSREAIFEKVANSNLKKSLSKSRERLCDMRLTLSKSRDYLNETSTKMAAVRSQEKFYGLKSLSRSTEVLALTSPSSSSMAAASGHLKRRVNGAMSDISPAHLPLMPRTYLDDSSCDFVILPGSSLLMSHADLMSLSSSSVNSCVLRTLTPEVQLAVAAMGSSGRTTPTTAGGPSPAAAADASGPPSSSVEASLPSMAVAASSLISKLSVQTVVEETEDEEEGDEEDRNRRSKMQRELVKEQTPPPPPSSDTMAKNSQRRKSMHDAQNNCRAVTALAPNPCIAKEEKNSINYETKQSIMSRSASTDSINQRHSSNSNSEEDGNRSRPNSNNNTVMKNNNSSSSRPMSRTAEVAVQVNLTRSCSSGNLVRRVQQEVVGPGQQVLRRGSSAGRDTVTASGMAVSGNMRGATAATDPEHKLTRGFSHDDTLGEEAKRYSWREELERFRATKKPLGVSDLIDAFSSSSSQLLSRKTSAAGADDTIFAPLTGLDQLKNQRRGSLQIQIDSRSLATLTGLAADKEQLGTVAATAVLHRSSNNNSVTGAKLQRRKSTSAIMPGLRGGSSLADMIQAPVTAMAASLGLSSAVVTVPEKEEEKADSEKEEEEEKQMPPMASNPSASCNADMRKEEGEEVGQGGASPALIHHQASKGRAYLDKVNERKRTWDYFEINHPKAISDKKLEQLKAKYTRRNTEACLAATTAAATAASAVDKKDEDTGNSSKEATTAANSRPGMVPTRTLSMPLIHPPQQLGNSSKLLAQLRPLSLAWDPLTGAPIGEEALDVEEEEAETRQEAVQEEVKLDKEEDHVASKRKSSSCFRLSGGHFADLLREEQIIPREEVLECFIDPFTGQFITSQVAKKESINSKSSTTTTSRRLTNNNNFNISSNVKQLKVSLNAGSPPPLPPVNTADDGFGSLPATPTDIQRTLPPPTIDYAESIQTDDGIYTSTEEVQTAQSPSITAMSSLCGFSPPSSSSSSSVRGDGDDGRDSTASEAGSNIGGSSVISGEEEEEENVSAENGQPTTSVEVATVSAASGRRSVSTGGSGCGADRPHRQQQQRERAVANKICTGSFSRGIERFRSESPAAAGRAAPAGGSSSSGSISDC